MLCRVGEKKTQKKRNNLRRKKPKVLPALALAGLWCCPKSSWYPSWSGKVLLGDEVGRETRSPPGREQVNCVCRVSRFLSAAVAAFLAPTAVVRCSDESDVCAQKLPDSSCEATRSQIGTPLPARTSEIKPAI